MPKQKGDGTHSAAEATTQGVLAAVSAAVAASHPDMVAPAAGVAAAIGVYLPMMVDRVLTFRFRQVHHAVTAGAEHTDTPIEELIDAASKTPFTELLTSDVFDAASRSAYHDKVTALGRAWAIGLLSEDEAELAREQQFVRMVNRIELPHVRVLDVVAGDFFAEAAGRGGPALVDGWTPEAVERHLSEYGSLIHPLLATLTAEGLIADNTIQNPMVAGTQFRVTPAGRDVLRRLREAAASSRGSEPPGSGPIGNPGPAPEHFEAVRAVIAANEGLTEDGGYPCPMNCWSNKQD